MQVQFLSSKDPLEESMATHSSILAWRVPWTEEPGGLRIRHDLATKQQLQHRNPLHHILNPSSLSLYLSASFVGAHVLTS